MRVLASVCHFPDEMAAGKSHSPNIVGSCAVNEEVAIDYLVAAVDRALQIAECKVENIDLIVSLSWTPDHIVDDTSVMGPRIGHPLQKRIGAKNAFVFDLMDSSLAKALHIVNQFSIMSGMSRVLVVRAELLKGIAPDVDNGFTIPDGAFAMVVAPDEHQRFISKPLTTESGSEIQSLRITLNSFISKNNPTKGRLLFKGAKQFDRAIQEAVGEMGAQDDHVSEKIHESWFASEDAQARPLGPFDIANKLQLIKHRNNSKLLAVSADPFTLSLEAVTLQLGTANNV